MEAYESLSSDPEPRCTLARSRRMRIAARYPALLPWRGLRPRELASLLQWEAMTPEEQERQKAIRRERMQRINAAKDIQEGQP